MTHRVSNQRGITSQASPIHLSRRSILQAAPLAVLMPRPSNALEACSINASEGTKLQALFKKDAQVQNLTFTPAALNPAQSRVLFYPPWFEGEWEFSDGQLVNVTNPFGMQAVTRTTPGVTKNSMIAALPDVGGSLNTDGKGLRFRQRFVKAGPSVNQANPSAIVPDRPYNLTQMISAFMGPHSVQSVEHDAAKEPTRLSIVYRTPRRDREGSFDLRKAEIFMNNRLSECGVDRGDRTFITAENIRQVDQASRSGYTFDYLNCYFYRLKDANTMEVSQRVAAFASPQDPQFFKTRFDAIALYDYSFLAKRI